MMKRQFILGVMMTAALGMSAQKAMNPPAGRLVRVQSCRA